MAKSKRSEATSKQTKISQNEPAASLPSDTNNGNLISLGITIAIIAILYFFGLQIMSFLLLIVIFAAFCIYWMTPSDVTGSAFPGNNIDLDFDDQNQRFDQSHLGSSDDDDFLTAAPPGEVSSGPSKDNKQPPTTKSKQSKKKPVEEDDEDDSDD